MFDGTTSDPDPRGFTSAKGHRIVVRVKPQIEVSGEQVGVALFGSDTKWMRDTFTEFIRLPESDKARGIHVRNLISLVRYCVKCDVEIVINRELWTYAKLFQ